MKSLRRLALSLVIYLGAASGASAEAIRTISDYNEILPYWGVTWTPGANSVSRYYPSFYTGFAPRSEFPERIHVRTSRGNQTRVSVILDEQTLSDYLFDLKARYDFYKRATTAPAGASRPMANTNPGGSFSAQPQVAAFFQIIESPEYGIGDFVERAKKGAESRETIYLKALDVIETLNPGRVFRIRLNLTQEFMNWKTYLQQELEGQSPDQAFSDPELTIAAINNLVLGRINMIEKPSAEVLSQLKHTAGLALTGGNDALYLEAALKLFEAVSGSKYKTRVVGESGAFVSALQCPTESDCFLVYPEFTAIYPTGALEKTTTRDEHGNSILQYATPGLWPFLDRSYHDVDHIRREPYYGFAPKMDFEGIGNGFHNPAVSFWGISKDVKEALGVPQDQSTLAAVKRGGVSSGCLRLALGHVWELRHIFPVENEKMKQVHFFGTDSRDFDLFDVDGDGVPQIMGVEYLIKYSLQGTSGLEKREGKELEVNADSKLAFYKDLYGSKNVFFYDSVTDDFIFTNPWVSHPSHLDLKQKRVNTREQIQGEYALYEQAYERDKVQFYAPYTADGLMTSKNHSPLSKRLVRLLGRVKGCAPFSNQKECGAEAFQSEAEQIFEEMY